MAESRGTKKVSQLSIPFRLNELNRQKFLLNHSLIFHGVKQYFLKTLKFWFSFYFISFCFVYYQILSFKSDIAVTLVKRHSADSRGTKKISQLSIPPKTQISKPGKPFWGERISTVDLLVLTSLDQLIFKLKILFLFLQNKQMRRSTVLSLPLS